MAPRLSWTPGSEDGFGFRVPLRLKGFFKGSFEGSSLGFRAQEFDWGFRVYRIMFGCSGLFGLPCWGAFGSLALDGPVCRQPPPTTEPKSLEP